jgi:hypothetical protein
MRGFLLALLLTLSASAAADDVDALLGAWISPDGVTKCDYVREFDGSWVTTRMWFKLGEEWELVAKGAMYQRPGENLWRMVGRSKDMGGIVLFESTFEFLGDGRVKLTNTAFNADGTTRIAEEDWQVTADEIAYDIFDIEAGERVPLFSGKWIRM